SAAPAATFKVGENIIIEESEVIDDNVYLLGGNVTVKGTVKGDLYILAGNARVTGTVERSLHVVAGNTRMEGHVGWSAHVATGSLRMQGHVERDLMIAAGQSDIARASRVLGSLFLDLGQGRVAGDVTKDIYGGVADLSLNGVVGRNVVVGVKQLTLLSKAHIKGNLIYTSDKPAKIHDGAKVDGKTEWKKRQKPALLPERGGLPVLFFLWRLLSALLVAMLLFALAPRFAQQVSDTIKRQPWISIGVGCMLCVSVPILCLFLLATVVGIPLALIAGLTYGVALYLSPMFAGLCLGQHVMQWVRRNGAPSSPFLDLAVGLFLLRLGHEIPLCVGYVVDLLSILIGLGAVTLTLWPRVARLPS
ncbi:MAG: polymer-forming cytoskeletal protein, partial [Abditibacteriales bacterium]|nr:polymer-forming cytoskeletal protein [Abditibacteriales bacterium]